MDIRWRYVSLVHEVITRLVRFEVNLHFHIAL